MKNVCEINLINQNNKLYNDMYSINSLIKMLLETCKNTEFNGQYYGIMDTGQRFKLSNERNNYINVLTILSDKMDELIKQDSSTDTNNFY